MKIGIGFILGVLALYAHVSVNGQTTDYQTWKQELDEIWNEENISTLASKVLSLIYFINDVSADTDSTRSTYQLYAYNSLRELLGVAPVQSISKADRQWLEQVEEEADPYEYMEKEKYDVPTIRQTQLLNQAKKLLKLEDDIHIFSFYQYDYEGEAASIKPGKGSIAICRLPDLDEQLGILYHEIGHIVHKDDENTDAVEAKRKTSKEVIGEPCFKNSTKIENCFEKDLEKIKHYLDLGKKAFDNSTPVGRRVNEVLSQYTSFWTPPEDEAERDEMIYFRGTEQRADLYEAEKLFKLNKMSAILQEIAKFLLNSDPIIAQPTEKHPSDFERGLYMAGFLVDKGIDINEAFKQWYRTGKCQYMPPDTLEALFSMPPKSQGARDFIKAYQAWQKEQEKEDLILWTEDLNETMEKDEVKTAPEKIEWLLWEILSFLSDIKEQPQDEESQWEAVQLYNVLRQLLNESPITTWQDIKIPWLYAEGYTSWKALVKEDWQDDGITTQAAKTDDLVKTVNKWLQDAKEEPENVNYQRIALYAYNFLRELLHEQPVKSLQNINQSWIDEQKQKISQ